MGRGRAPEMLVSFLFLNSFKWQKSSPWLIEKEPKHRMFPATHRQGQAQRVTQVGSCWRITPCWHKQTRCWLCRFPAQGRHTLCVRLHKEAPAIVAFRNHYYGILKPPGKELAWLPPRWLETLAESKPSHQALGNICSAIDSPVNWQISSSPTSKDGFPSRFW